ncbi:OB-fold domain-containing protein [Alcanivorax marinus]|nr:OB-fold domain-containing protein [Alloalcanivorax marinus]
MNDNAINPAGPAARVYAETLAAGRFRIQRCQDCDSAIFYPRELCPACGSGDLHWFAPSGRGTVYATTTVRRKEEAGGDYNVALIDLEEGPRLMSRVDGLSPDAVCIGQPVRARVAVEEDQGVLLFDAVEVDRQPEKDHE